MRLAHHINEILHLRTIVEQGSINRAAGIIGLSQPALTRSIRRLEEALGVKLLDRTARGVVPTPFGELLINHGRSIDSELQRAADSLQIMKGGGGSQFNCGGTIGALNALFPSAVAALTKEKPKLRLRIVEGVPAALLGMVRTGELDVAVCAKVDKRSEPDLASEIVAEDRIDIIARRGHPLLAGKENSLRALVQTQRWILPNASGAMHQLIQRRLESLGLPMPARVSETSSITMLRALLLNTDQIAVTTSHTLGPELKSGALLRLAGDWTWPTTQTIVYRRRNTASTPLIRSFTRLLQAAAGSA